MLACISEIVLGLLLMTNILEQHLFNLFNLTCGFEVADMGCVFISLSSLVFGLFLITDASFTLWQYWRTGKHG